MKVAGRPTSAGLGRRCGLSSAFATLSASAADINQDGILDVVAGPVYFLGPDFTVMREISLSQTVNPSNTYDSANRVISQTDAMTRTYQFAYASTDITSTTTITDPRNNATTIGYDTSGRVSTVTRGSSITTFTYPTPEPAWRS